VVGRRPLLVVAFVPDPSSLSSPGGNQPVLAASSRITRCWPPVSSGLTPPGRAGWQSPPTATRDPGHHPCGVNGVHLGRTGGSEMSCTRRGDLFPQVGWSRIPRRCRRCLHNHCGLAVSSRALPHHSGSDSAGHRQAAMIPSGRRQRRGIRDEGDHKQRPPPNRQTPPHPPLQSARRRRRLFTMVLSFRHPTQPPAASEAQPRTTELRHPANPS